MPIGVRPSGLPPQFTELKGSVRRLLGLDDDTAVVIRQLACAEPGCPPLGTVIAVLPMDGPARRWTLHRPADAITEDDLRPLLSIAPEGA
ncbi:hypothetical protein NGB36_28790 [Streptomyces sp. RB6PN25]|uniref:Nitrate reductase n=1 Tax=Streptomyces humicola TaxID=2953240 RepID=A0ABT1Q3G8_9ACTN|nr:hypothetical protein [Streptomyces humicola]MCQ4084464.1 hypothetical protein [Streptomyces humicola]